MFIQTEQTPNPEAIKFLPGRDISPQNPQHFGNVEDAKKRSSLAVKLFEIPGVIAVFFGSDFITITKDVNYDWNILKPEILMIIMDHIMDCVRNNLPIIEQKQEKIILDVKDLSEIEKQIIEIIETRVRPSVAMDGGDITYVGFDNGIVQLSLKGACGGCPSASVTLKSGIEALLQLYIPEVKGVEAVAQEIE